MILRFDKIKFHILTDKEKAKGKTPVVFLHGFTGSSEEWQPLFSKISPEFFPLAIDLIGHGKSSSPEEINFYSVESITNHIMQIFNYLEFNKVILVGYSMGGRAALSFAVRFPDKIEKLILESSTAGIENEDERKQRQISDNKLAGLILRDGIEKFTEYWLSLPLFESLKNISANDYEKLRLRKLRNNPVGLSNMLKGFGTGIMPPLWKNLKDLRFPVLLITGSLDEKFTRINRRMKKLLPSAQHKIIEGAGHNVHIEKSEDFIILVNEFLSKNSKREI